MNEKELRSLEIMIFFFLRSRATSNDELVALYKKLMEDLTNSDILLELINASDFMK